MRQSGGPFTLRPSLFHLILLTPLFLLLPSTGNAQFNSTGGLPTITSYMPKDYKGHNQIWTIIQDERGFMYFGTSAGIMEYNGVNWNKLKFPKTSSAISNRAFYKDKNGRIFYGALGDLGYFDLDAYGNTRMVSLLDYLPAEYRIFNDIWTIHQVGNQLFFQARAFIFIFDISAGLDTSKVDVWKPDTEFMYAFYENGEYIVHQQALGLFKLVGNTLELIPGSEFLGKERLQVLMSYSTDTPGPPGFLTGMFASGMYHYDGKNFNAFPTKAYNTTNNENRLYKGLKLPDGRYALAFAGHGASIIDKYGKVQYLFNLSTGIPDESVYALYLDKSGLLWLGTENGIAKIEISSSLSRFPFSQTIIPNILSLNNIGNDLYLGTATEVLKLDHKDGQIKSVPGIPYSQIFKMEKDGDDLLIASEGLVAIRNEKVITIKESVGGNFQVLDILVSKFYPDLMYCSGSFGIAVFKRSMTGPSANNSWIFLGNIEGISKDIYNLIEDEEGLVWGGTQAGVVYKIKLGITATREYDLKGTKVELVGPEQGLLNAPGSVSKIKGKPYFPTSEGFFTYNKITSRFERDSVFSFTTRTAELSAENALLIEDNLGRVLVSFDTEKKLALPRHHDSFVLEDYPVNLFTGEIITSFFSEPDSTIWLGTDEGLIRIDGKTGDPKTRDFKLYLTQITAASDTLSHVSQIAGGVIPERDFKNNSLRFGFAAPFFEQENLILFQTFLEGFDKDWSAWDKNAYKEYTNLPPGTYTFRVRSKNIFNVVSNETAHSFIILNPWYSTWWAYLFYFVSAFLVIFGLVKYRSRQLMSQNLILEKKVNLRTEQLKKSLDDLKATQEQLIQSEKMAGLGELTAGIAHEIQNPLNFVNNFSEVNMELIDEMKDELKRGNIDGAKTIADDIKQNELKINHHGKRADAIVKGMLQHSRSSSGVKEPTDINALTDEYLRLAYHGLRAKDKSFNAAMKTDFDESIKRINIIPQDIGRVILNLFTNAFYSVMEKKKQSTGKFEPAVSVSTRKINGSVEIRVKDNGNGIPQKVMDKIFQPFFTTKPAGEGTGLGLSISYDIIKAHDGVLKVETSDGEGAEFIIVLPE